MALQQFFGREPRLVALDVGETLALFLLPALVVGFGLALVGGSAGFLTGLFAGGLLGAAVARGRWTLRAVRTENGIERATYSPASLDSDENPISFAYDEKYDKLLAVVFVAVGTGAFAAVALNPSNATLGLVSLGFVAWVAALAVIGVIYS